jgi:hypothetical protein
MQADGEWGVGTYFKAASLSVSFIQQYSVLNSTQQYSTVLEADKVQDTVQAECRIPCPVRRI